MRVVCDRVYGEIVLGPLADTLVQTKELARLDGVRQQGACSFVYPSATHTRLEHSIGVYHLAGVMGARLRELEPAITAHDVELVRLAGLLHDVGHGPFSHVFETYAVGWSHEALSVALTRSLLADALNVADVECVVAMIAGDAPSDADAFARRFERPYATHRALFDVVHSPCGIDVDRMDYLVRDALSVFGASAMVDTQRIVRSLRIRDGGVSFHEGVALSIQQIFELRMRLHKQVYQHREVLVVEEMLRAHMAAMDAACPQQPLRARVATLTDYSILATMPDVARLHAHPRFHRVDNVHLLVPTSPLCGTCRAVVASRFCPACGASVDGADPAPHHVTSDAATAHLRRALRRTDVHVFITHITYGTPTASGEYRALPAVPFHDAAGRGVSLTDADGPACRHYRKVYVYTEAPSTLTADDVVGPLRAMWEECTLV